MSRLVQRDTDGNGHTPVGRQRLNQAPRVPGPRRVLRAILLLELGMFQQCRDASKLTSLSTGK
jgi:hypothetical protein